MTTPPSPSFQAASAHDVRNGPHGLTIIGHETISPESIAVLQSLFKDKYTPQFRATWIYGTEEDKDFLCDFLFALKNTPEGLQALVTALLTQGTIDLIGEDRYFDIPQLIEDLPQDAREQLLLDEDGFALQGIQNISGFDIIQETISNAADPGRKIKLITANKWATSLVIQWLDTLPPESRAECLEDANVIMSLGDGFFYDEKIGAKVEHALDRWGAHYLRKLLHYTGSILKDREIMFWTCLAPALYSEEEMGDFQAPPLPPLPAEPPPPPRPAPQTGSQPLTTPSDDDWDIPF